MSEAIIITAIVFFLLGIYALAEADAYYERKRIERIITRTRETNQALDIANS